MNEFLFAAILFVAIVMILTAMLVATRAMLAPDARMVMPPELDAAADAIDTEVRKSMTCKVLSSRTVAPLIREIVLALPEGEHMHFAAGAWVEVSAPPFELSFSDYALSTEHRSAWDRMGLWGLSVSSNRRETRPYWIANTVEDGSEWIVLLVRLALPPPDHPRAHPGKVSSWLFGLRTSDEVKVRGPDGGAKIAAGDSELILVGAGHGMAPIRAILSDQLTAKGTRRKIGFWYGARTEAELFHREELDRLAANHPNFSWTATLSHPTASPEPSSETGFLHEVVYRQYLKDHPAPEDCEYHLYGPPLMIGSVLAMLDDLGVDATQIQVNGHQIG